MQKLSKKLSTLPGILLLIASNACASGARRPVAPDIKDCLIDLERQRSICFTIVSEEGPEFLRLDQMERYSCRSPEDKAKYDNFVKELQRKWDRLEASLVKAKLSGGISGKGIEALLQGKTISE